MNLTTSRIASTLTVFLYLIVILRILLGPLSVVVAIFHHYLMRLAAVSFLTMITFNRVLKTLFILDFQRISLVPEQRLIGLFAFVTIFTSTFYMVQEAVVRDFRGLNHYGSWALSIYIGKVMNRMD